MLYLLTHWLCICYLFSNLTERTFDPKWSDPSLDTAQAGATCTRLPFFTERTFEIDNNLHDILSLVQCSNVAHKKPDVQNLFGIVQGGLDPVLRWVHLACNM
jgi:hypothetical protein